MRKGTVWVVLALVAGGCGTSLTNPDPVNSLRFRVRPPVAFEMLHDDETLPIVDLRPRAAFEGSGGHLARAYNLPLSELPGRLSDLSDLKPRTFLVYCGSDESCGDRALEVFHDHGYRAVLMDGGIEEWIANGFGTVDHATECGKEQRESRNDLLLAQGVQ